MEADQVKARGPKEGGSGATEVPEAGAETGNTGAAFQPVDRLIERWFSEGTTIGLILNELTSATTDEERATELFDLIFDRPPAFMEEIFSEPVLEVDEHGEILRVPHRPIGAPVVVALGGLCLIWGAWAWMLVQDTEHQPDAMVGTQQVQTDHPAHHEHWSPHQSDALHQSEEANFSGDAVSLSPPEPGQWLYEFPEQGQTFHQYLAGATHTRDDKRFVLYIVPLGHLQEGKSQAIFGVLPEYLGAYYDVPVRVLPTVPLPSRGFSDERGQYDARRVLKDLGESLPEDGVGLLAMTEADLFIPSVNFVFGLGSRRHKAAVFSTFRYGDDFRLVGEERTVFKRSLIVAVHELGHVVSMRHCTAFKCIMNGTSSLKEADAHPMHLCPVCLQKAEVGFAFQRGHRYKRLLEFYDRHGFMNEAAFVWRRLNPPDVDYTSNL